MQLDVVLRRARREDGEEAHLQFRAVVDAGDAPSEHGVIVQVRDPRRPGGLHGRTLLSVGRSGRSRIGLQVVVSLPDRP